MHNNNALYWTKGPCKLCNICMYTQWKTHDVSSICPHGIARHMGNVRFDIAIPTSYSMIYEYSYTILHLSFSECFSSSIAIISRHTFGWY